MRTEVGQGNTNQKEEAHCYCADEDALQRRGPAARWFEFFSLDCEGNGLLSNLRFGLSWLLAFPLQRCCTLNCLDSPAFQFSQALLPLRPVAPCLLLAGRFLQFSLLLALLFQCGRFSVGFSPLALDFRQPLLARRPCFSRPKLQPLLIFM